MKKISTLSKNKKNKNLQESIEFFNQYIIGIKNYYLKVITDKNQLTLLQNHIEQILIKKIVLAKQNKIINQKIAFLKILMKLDDFEHREIDTKKDYAKLLIKNAYDIVASENPLQNAKNKIEKKKVEYLKEQLKSSEIVLNRFGLHIGLNRGPKTQNKGHNKPKFGLHIGLNRGKVIVKEYGKTISTTPIGWVSRIIVMSKGTSISTALIFECSNRKIDIDFIEKSKPYAQLIYLNTLNNELHLKQLDMKNNTQGLDIAKSIIKAKMKNQINLLKYFNRYRHEHEDSDFLEIDKFIKQMESIFTKVDTAQNTQSLMGFEGSLSVAYWRGFGILIKDKAFKRETQNATDSTNQALNYGYAFIYHRVQSALVKSGLNIYNSFIHSNQPHKPTLVFDVVEMFRQFVVDREIISILNHGTELKSDKGKLTQESIKVITKHIQDRLATPTKWRNKKYKMVTIIEDEATELAQLIRGTKSVYKAFVARF